MDIKTIHIKNLDTFLFIVTGKKKFELRRMTNFFTSIVLNEIVIIRWTIHSIKCKITSITEYDTLDDVFNDIKFDKDDVPFNSLVPNCKNSNEGITKYLNYYKKYESLNNKYLLFGISIVI